MHICMHLRQYAFMHACIMLIYMSAVCMYLYTDACTPASPAIAVLWQIGPFVPFPSELVRSARVTIPRHIPLSIVGQDLHRYEARLLEFYGSSRHFSGSRSVSTSPSIGVFKDLLPGN